MVQTILISALQTILKELGHEIPSIKLERPGDSVHGDYSTNVALIAAKQLGMNPRELASKIKEKLEESNKKLEFIERVEIAGPGFINFYLTESAIYHSVSDMLEGREIENSLTGKRIMIEYAHPNTHKEMHIGHMRTLITGEAIARLLEANEAVVFRANYQGDIGPHIAKALYGIKKILQERELSIEQINEWNNKDKTHLLGEGYVRGNKDYESQKEEIDSLNKALYEREEVVWNLYTKTRKWNLDYYEEFYTRFHTKFDRLFFESEMDQEGSKIVKSNLGSVFLEENGAIIFPGEKYGLHTRVFITKAGYPTYEGKEMANAFEEYKAFPFDLKMHVVASEQNGYFQVIFKALELLDSEKFLGKQYHVSMGMVQLKDRKISSRTGDVLTVDWLLDQVKKRVEQLASEGRIDALEKDKTVEQIVIGAVKYSVLKVVTTQDAAFDIETSVSLDGNSGPYLQYSYARTQSVLRKANVDNDRLRDITRYIDIEKSAEEISLLRMLYKYREVITEAGEKYAPNILCTYLFELTQQFNLFYQKHQILKSDEEIKQFRLTLTAAVGYTIKNGLSLLGIESPEKM